MELVSRVLGAVMHFVAWLKFIYVSRENVSIFMVKEKAKQETSKKLAQSKKSHDYLAYSSADKMNAVYFTRTRTRLHTITCQSMILFIITDYI
jgi:hypothetical protein